MRVHMGITKPDDVEVTVSMVLKLSQLERLHVMCKDGSLGWDLPAAIADLTKKIRENLKAADGEGI